MTFAFFSQISLLIWVYPIEQLTWPLRSIYSILYMYNVPQFHIVMYCKSLHYKMKIEWKLNCFRFLMIYYAFIRCNQVLYNQLTGLLLLIVLSLCKTRKIVKINYCKNNLIHKLLYSFVFCVQRLIQRYVLTVLYSIRLFY